MEQWQETDDFLQTCEKNLELVKEAYHDPKPVRLHPFKDFTKHADLWWEEFFADGTLTATRIKQLGNGNLKFNYHKKYHNIPVIPSLSNNLFGKIFNSHKVVMWLSLDDEDTGTDWHQDFCGEWITPTYLICMNLVGETHWQFEGYDDMILKPGDVIAQNGSVNHKVTPVHHQNRITLAGHSKLTDIKI